MKKKSNLLYDQPGLSIKLKLMPVQLIVRISLLLKPHLIKSSHFLCCLLLSYLQVLMKLVRQAWEKNTEMFLHEA